MKNLFNYSKFVWRSGGEAGRRAPEPRPAGQKQENVKMPNSLLRSPWMHQQLQRMGKQFLGMSIMDMLQGKLKLSQAEKLKLQKLGKSLIALVNKLPKPKEGIVVSTTEGSLYIVLNGFKQVVVTRNLGSTSHTYFFNATTGEFVSSTASKTEAIPQTTPDGLTMFWMRLKSIRPHPPTALPGIIQSNNAKIQTAVAKAKRAAPPRK